MAKLAIVLASFTVCARGWIESGAEGELKLTHDGCRGQHRPVIKKDLDQIEEAKKR